jgi:hypothetical protein
MKVNTPTGVPDQQQPSNVNKAVNKRGSADSSSATDDDGAVGGVQGRDFASLLEDVARPRETKEHESEEGERHEDKSSTGAEREQQAQRRQDQREGGMTGGGFGQRGGVAEAALRSESLSARAILHIADLEKIVAVVRSQLIVAGRPEVTLELHRSVLEGLRVKLSTDSAGRINAEFIATTERVRAQLDARSADLAELLRARGLELGSLHTTVSPDSNRNAPGDGQQQSSAEAFAPAGVADAPLDAVSSNDVSQSAGDLEEGASTYRA